MKTSVIRYRVADFLREFPPFEAFSLEDLLLFSGTGRVAFHEDDIYLFRKGQAREPLIWVIEQGRVELLDDTPAGERLCDVRGRGDTLGLSREEPSDVHPLTARTVTEVIIYSFDAVAFKDLAQKYPEAMHYLAADLATSRHTKALLAPSNRERLMTEREKASWVNAAPTPSSLLHARLVTCGPELPMHEAMKLLAGSDGVPAVVISRDSRPLGWLSESSALRAAPGEPVGMCMSRTFQTARRGLRTSEYLLGMLRNRCQELVITADGTSDTAVEGVVTHAELAIDCGRSPTIYQRAMLSADSVEELSYLRGRAAAFLVEELAGPSVVEWFWQMQGALDTALTERIVSIAMDEMVNVGRVHPECRSCWIALGKAGRSELLTREPFGLGLLYDDPPAVEREDADKYFSMLAHKVGAKLRACGFPDSVHSGASFARALSGWKQIYADLIQDPIGKAIYNARELLDLQVICGDRSLAGDLLEAICRELREQVFFIPVLANDTLANLPPLTFFQGLVVEADGSTSSATMGQTVDLEKTALSPLSDAARVFAMASVDLSNSNTLHRLEAAARRLPQHASVFRDASDAMRIASYQNAITAFKAGGPGSSSRFASLGRFEQRLLKSSFDAIRRLLELTATIHNLTDHL